MDRNAARAVGLAAIGVLAVALAAATLTTAVTTTSGTGIGFGGDGDGGIAGSGDGGVLPLPASRPDPGDHLTIPFLGEAMTLLLVVSLLLAAFYAVRHWRDTVRLVASFVAIGILAWLLVMVLPDPSPPEVRDLPVAPNGSLLGGAGGGHQGATQPLPPAVVLFLLLGVWVVGAAVMLARGEPADDDPDEPVDPVGSNTAAVGLAAGQAADRIEDAEAGDDVDNEVYRAWRDMTGLLEVSTPEATTPGEFADAAVSAGMHPDDVNELTRLFEDVRYGGREPSPSSERRAVRVFRRIEEEYAEAEG